MLKFLFILLVPFFVFAQNLELEKGLIKAHTEVFGDSTIDPSTNQIKTNLSISDNINSIKGFVEISAKDLISDNKDRDEHMYGVLDIVKFPNIVFEIKSISKENINGVLTLHGVSKNISVPTTIVQNKNTIDIKSKFSINMTDYGMEPPVLLFLTVRDQVDIEVNLSLK